MLNEIIIDAKTLLPKQKEQMYDLMCRHYDNCNKTIFLDDLSDKNGVLMLYDNENNIVGFSTYKIINILVNGKAVEILFSGDTIVDNSVWGSRSPFKIFGKLLHQLICDKNKEQYWFLISKGHRTYLFLPLFFNEFYPCIDKQTPDKYAKMLNTLCIKTFDAPLSNGSYVFKAGADHLKEKFAIAKKHQFKNKHIQFFNEQNPGYLNGDELLCIAPLNEENLSEFGKRCCALYK